VSLTGLERTDLDVVVRREWLVCHLTDAGVGCVSELAQGDPPFEPRGCPWAAWSVGERLRVWWAAADG